MRRAIISLTGMVALGVLPIAAGAAPSHNLSISAAPNPVVFGHAATVSGKYTGKGHASKQVALQADPYPYGDGWLSRAVAFTDNNGDYAIKDQPRENTRYRTYQGATFSNVVTERVRIRVSLRLSDRTPRSGQRVRFYGRACPEHDGAVVGIQRYSNVLKRWRTIRRTRLKDLPTCSKYSRRIRVFRDGTYRTKVASPDHNHANGYSRKRHIDAHR